MVDIEFSSRYRKMFRELINERPELHDEVIWCVERFRKNQKDTRLKVHPLRHYLKGKFALKITGDIRIIFERQGKYQVRFLAIGQHNVVYKKG